MIGASNRPEELDDAVRRRLAKRIHIPLPDAAGREGALRRLLRGQNIRVSRKEWQWIVDHTEGYSASDIKELCHEGERPSLFRDPPNLPLTHAPNKPPFCLPKPR